MTSMLDNNLNPAELSLPKSRYNLGNKYILVDDRRIRILPRYRHKNRRKGSTQTSSDESANGIASGKGLQQKLTLDFLRGARHETRGARHETRGARYQEHGTEEEEDCDDEVLTPLLATAEELVQPALESRTSANKDWLHNQNQVLDHRLVSEDARSKDFIYGITENVIANRILQEPLCGPIKELQRVEDGENGNKIYNRNNQFSSSKKNVSDESFNSNRDRIGYRSYSTNNSSHKSNKLKRDVHEMFNLTEFNNIKPCKIKDNEQHELKSCEILQKLAIKLDHEVDMTGVVSAKSEPGEVQVISGVVSRRAQCVNCCKRFLAFLFSTVGSCCLLVGYTILGGLVFKELEANHELSMKDDMKNTRAELVLKLWNMTLELNILHPKNWSAEADKILTDYTKNIFQATKKRGWDGGTDDELELQWSFPGALLYSITVVTTIGYGHIAPRTDWGKVVTIIYAIFGIPLTLFTITNLGSIMATAFRFLYRYVCCGLCCLCCVLKCYTSPHSRSRNRKRSARLSRRDRFSAKRFLDSENLGKSSPDGRNLMEKIPGSDSDNAMIIHTIYDPDKQDIQNPEIPLRQRIMRALNPEGTSDSIEKISVPIYVSLLLMLGYIGLGSLVFKLSEDWDTLICLYFCFITLSTIGFGDYVPGTRIDKLGSQEMLVLCALYLVFGLALIAMCFNLIQEEAKNKFRRLGKRLGILSEND